MRTKAREARRVEIAAMPDTTAAHALNEDIALAAVWANKGQYLGAGDLLQGTLDALHAEPLASASAALVEPLRRTASDALTNTRALCQADRAVALRRQAQPPRCPAGAP
jgi:hypothetical protein